MQIGFLKRSPRGRMATPKAYEHLGKKLPATKSQPKLFEEK
ncbi:MAG: Holliday junction branch migration DNA helicase RuvB, partial [Candidatus Omnitrophica bacterium]|nr:Holliday junction branch migration DNA helicase RuvB [Candidatus Omnitrophota bacterium]